MTPNGSDASQLEAPASVPEVRSAYIDQLVLGYLLYGVGAVTAFLAAALALSDAQAALHSSLLASGLLVAGFAGDRVDAAIGLRRANVLAYALLAAGSSCLMTAPAYAVTLAGAAMIGLAVGLLLAHLNRTLTRGAGALAQVRISRAALVAMVGSMSVPVVIGLGDNSGLGWQVAFVVAGVFIALGLWGTRWRVDVARSVLERAGSLSRGYWLTWLLLVLGVAVEFAFVFWSSTLVERQLEIPLADATLVATSFYVGMATTRLALSFTAIGGGDPIGLVRLGLVVATAGALLAWTADEVVLAAAGVFLGGVGAAFQYPLIVAVALALVPSLADKGSARLILASGVAILAAPLVLGFVADAAGVSIAWLLIPAVSAAALVLSVPVERARAAGARARA